MNEKMASDGAPHLLIVTGGFYQDIARKLEEGAISALEKSGCTYDLVEVPGALEIPAVLSLAIDGGRFASSSREKYDGFVALGCIIRGETYHFEIVSNESSRGLTDLALRHHIPLGNGILTVETMAQALARLSDDNHKGEHAVEACLSLIKYKKNLTVAAD